jgi:hypothetical protein
MVPNEKGGVGVRWGLAGRISNGGRGTSMKFRNHLFLALTLLVDICWVERSR